MNQSEMLTSLMGVGIAYPNDKEPGNLGARVRATLERFVAEHPIETGTSAKAQARKLLGQLAAERIIAAGAAEAAELIGGAA